MEGNSSKHFCSEVPFDQMYQASRKEASRKKPVFFLHKYFARRITANYRMALLDYISDGDDNLLDKFYSKSDFRNDITVMDPFMGGGTTIFEALRFRCNVIGTDLQPLSLFVTSALVKALDEKAVNSETRYLAERVGERIKSYYSTVCPQCGEMADGMYSFHVKTVSTTSPCKKHKLFSSFVLAYKKDVFTVVCPKCGSISETRFEGGVFTCGCGWELRSPKESYVNRGVFTCPDCHESKALSEFANEGGYPFDTEIVAIEYYCPHCKAHGYKAPDNHDTQLYKKACADYSRAAHELPIPDQQIPAGYNTNQIINHGYKKFSDLFNARQLLCLGILLDEINRIENSDVQFWMQLAFSGMLEMNNMFCRYQQNAYKISNIFFNHAYVPISMPVENCVWGTKLGTGTFLKTINKIIRGKRFNKEIYDIAVEKNEQGRFDSIKMVNGDTVEAAPVEAYKDMDGSHPLLRCADSRDLSFVPDDSVDLVLTDPPYGANVMYSELIDFFHVWNYKSTLAEKLGFKEPLSPKSQEIIVNSAAGKDSSYYHKGLTEVFAECHSKLREDGYLVFSFHDKYLDSWTAILDSIFESGYRLIDCYPVQSETRSGAHTSNKNSIGIDIMLISKKRPSNEPTEIAITDRDVRLASETARDRLVSMLDKMKDVEAEITVPDIHNIFIPVYFVALPMYAQLDTLSKAQVKSNLGALLEEIGDIAEDYATTTRRSGWWSELYRKKWSLAK